MKPMFLIYLFVFVIGVAESSDWFVQEVVEYDEGGDPFSQEDLLPLHRQPSLQQTGHQQNGHHTAQTSPQKAGADVVTMTSERRHGDAKDTVVSELEDQHLIPVKTGSKQKTKPVQAGSKTPASATSPKLGAKDVFKTESATTEKRNATVVRKDEPTRDTTTGRKGGERKLLSKEEEVHPVIEDDETVEIRPEPKICEEPEKDVDCLFEEEELIPVIKKPRTQKKSPPKPKTTQTEQKSSSSQKMGAAEEGNHVAQRKLLQMSESSSNERRVSNNSKIDIESRPGDNGNDEVPPATQEKPMQPPVGEKEEVDEEEEEALADLEDVLWRVKRQAGGLNDQEFSGATSPAITTSTAPTTTPDPSFLIRTTGDVEYETEGWDMEVDTTTCKSTQAQVEQDVRSALEKYFSGLKNVVAGMNLTFVITPKANGKKYVVSWKMKYTKLGATPENEIDKILAHIQGLPTPSFQAGTCKTTHPNNGKANFVERMNTTLSDPCNAPDPCPLGYEKCEKQRRGVGRCYSKCLTSGVNAKCENGAPCITEPKGQPSCQCKAGYTGRYCEALAGDGSLPTAPTPTVANVTTPGFQIVLNKTKVGNLTKDQIADQVKKDLMKQFKDKNITDFDIEITDVTIAPNGSVVVNWNFKLGNANGNRQERAQEIISSLGNANTPETFTILNSSYTVPPIDLANLGNSLHEKLRNPCLDTVCAFGFNCTLPYDYGEPTCTHKCLSNAYAQKCKHGTCELNRQTGEPYCLCTNKFKGEFCDQSKASDQQTALSTPQIVGTTAGALIVAAAVASCCLYFLLCRKKSQRDISFSYLEDQDQDIEGFSDASSKLYNCYLDRPRVTVEPLDIYGMNQEFNS